MDLSVDSYITIPKIFSFLLHTAGILFLYINRKDLLYDNEDGDPNTPNTLSLGRCWAWAVFYFACSYWIGYMTGSIAPTTPFPPVLEDMLFVCLAYEFFKKGWDIGRIWLSMRDFCTQRPKGMSKMRSERTEKQEKEED